MDNGSSRLQQLHKKKTKAVLDKTGWRAFSFDAGHWEESKQQQLTQSGMSYSEVFPRRANASTGSIYTHLQVGTCGEEKEPKLPWP